MSRITIAISTPLMEPVFGDSPFNKMNFHNYELAQSFLYHHSTLLRSTDGDVALFWLHAETQQGSYQVFSNENKIKIDIQMYGNEEDLAEVRLGEYEEFLALVRHAYSIFLLKWGTELEIVESEYILKGYHELQETD
jgi:hypothetical protein